MVTERKINSPISPADQSTKGKGPQDANNFNIEKLILPAIKTWNTVNIDLDAAVYIKNITKGSSDTISLSQTDCYLVIPILRVIKASKNFCFNKPLEVSNSKIAKIIFSDSNENSVKKVKEILDFLSKAKFPDGNTVCCSKKRNGSSPILIFNNSIVFDYLKKNNNDYLKVSRQTMKNHIVKILGKPKALSVFLEETFICGKRLLKNKDSEVLRQRSDSRLYELYYTKTHHSLSETKKAGTTYLIKAFGNNFRAIIKKTAEDSLTSEEKNKYLTKVHGVINFECNQYAEPDFHFVDEYENVV